MTLEKLKISLSKYGHIQIIKEGIVFTLLMTGSNMAKWNDVSEIQRLVIDYTGKKYPTIEAMRNDENFFCMILKP